MPSTKSRYSSKIEISRGRYGVCKYQYWKLDCLDLFIELLILLNCKILGTCRPCTNLLRFVVETLRNKWDDIRFIDFEEALALLKISKPWYLDLFFWTTTPKIETILNICVKRLRY